MPVVEVSASRASACVSTAPLFSQEGGRGDGARKSRDPGWWALMEHNGGRDPGARSSWAVSLVWLAWLLAFAGSALVPVPDRAGLFAAMVGSLGVAATWIPDQGDTVLPYYCIVIVPIVVFKGAAMGGWWSFAIVPAYFLLAVLDCLVGVDVGNQTREVQRALHGAFRFELLTLLVAPGVLACIAYGAWLVSFGGLSLFEAVGLGLGVGFITGVIGIVAGHELCHRASWYERLLGRLLLCSAFYGHFYVEHTLGHHKWVATDHDPATARFGETLYEFLPRVVKGEFVSACHIEAARLKRKGLAWWHGEIPLYFVASLALALGLAGLAGSAALPFFLFQSAVAVLLFESVNYIEHYGLERVEVKPGEFEQVQPKHSWDAPTRVTNHLLFKLQRHADHHAHAGKRYQTLQAYDSAPQMPSGYVTMLLLAFAPPLWRAVMHPRLLAYRRQQVGQAFRHGPTPEAARQQQQKPSDETTGVTGADGGQGEGAVLRCRAAGA